MSFKVKNYTGKCLHFCQFLRATILKTIVCNGALEGVTLQKCFGTK